MNCDYSKETLKAIIKERDSEITKLKKKISECEIPINLLIDGYFEHKKYNCHELIKHIIVLEHRLKKSNAELKDLLKEQR